jgi:hypothetical protein
MHKNINKKKKLFFSRLEDNRLACDCDAYWLWLAANSDSSPSRAHNFALSAVCYSPDDVRNKRLGSMYRKDFKCVEPIIVDKPKDLEISSNTLNPEARFECKAIGYPAPAIQWFKDG